MAYEKRTWVSGTTPCSAENFNHMEDGIAAANEGVDKLNTDKSNKLMVKSWNYASANVQNTSVAVDGYTAIGVVGWYVPNASGVFCQLYVSDNKLTMASSLTSQVSVRVYILYVKN